MVTMVIPIPEVSIDDRSPRSVKPRECSIFKESSCKAERNVVNVVKAFYGTGRYHA